jgi:hypothetical protein
MDHHGITPHDAPRCVMSGNEHELVLPTEGRNGSEFTFQSDNEPYIALL